MTVIGSASIDIRANDRYFEPDVRRAVAKIKNVNIDLRVNADMAAANKKIRDLRYRMSNNEIQIPIRANDAKFDTDVRAAVRKIRNVQIDLKADVDVAKASKKIRDLRYRITRNDAVLKVDANLAKAEEKMRKFLEKFVEKEINFHAKAHTQGAHTALSELQSRYGGPVNYTATANTSVARAALAHAARTRHAKIVALVDAKSMAALSGAFNMITGTLPFDKIKNSITGLLSDFEGIMVKAGMFTTLIGAASSSVLTLGANIFSIAGDITHVVGIAAMLPAIFTALGTSIAANKMAWKGFGEALSEDPKKAAKAMEALPPEARKAADAMRGMGKEIQQATQVSFWEALGTRLQDMATTLLPELKEGFASIGTSMGGFQGNIFSTMERSLGNGVLLGILGNVSGMLRNATSGAGFFTQAMITLTSVGSTYLPRFGDYITEVSGKFNNFIQSAEQSGDIFQWVDTSIRRFRELGSIVGSTSSILKSITDVARMSGAPGLTEFANGLKSVAETAGSEPFQSQLLNVLVGARQGTDALGEGISTLTEYFWESSDSVRHFLTLTGEIAGLTFSNITALFNGSGLGSGLYTALLGLREAMDILEPGFRDLGGALGGIGEIAGELFVNMAPGLNMLAETVKGVVDGLKGGIIDAMPVFNEFAQAVLQLVSGPVVALATGIGNLLSAFSELPGFVQTAIMSMGLFLLLKPKFMNFWTGFSAPFRKEESAVGTAFRSMRDNGLASMRALRTDIGNVGTSMRTVMSTTASGIGQNFRLMGTAAGGVLTDMGKKAAPAASAIGGAFQSLAGRVTPIFSSIGQGMKSALVVDGELDRASSGFGRMQDRFLATAANVGSAALDMRDKVASSATGMASQSSAAFGTIAGHARSAFDRIPVGFGKTMGDVTNRASTMVSSVGNSVSQMAGKFNSNLAPARTAMSQLGTHAVNTGKTIGTGLAAGVSSAAKGISGVLGGPWGIAIMGATMALGAFAQSNAKAKADVEALKGTLDEASGAFTNMTRMELGKQILDLDRSGLNKFSDWLTRATDGVDVLLDRLGTNLDRVTTKLTSDGADQYIAGWEAIKKSMRTTGTVSEELAGKVGLSKEALESMSSAEIDKVANNIIDAGEAAAKAAEQNRALAESMGVSEVAAQELQRNYDILSSLTSTVADKTSALKRNLDLLSGGKRTAADAAKEYHQTLADTGKALEEISQREGVVVKDLVSIADGFDMTSQAGRDLHTALDGQADAILTTAMAAFDQARKGGASMEAAQETAVAAMQQPIQALKQTLAGLGFEPGQIDRILDDLNLLKPEDIKLAISADGDPAIQEAARVELAMRAFANGKFEAVLGALPQDAMAKVAEAMGLADEYSRGEYEAILTAFDATPGGREAALAGLIAFDGTDYEAFLKANNLIPEEVANANEAVAGLVGEKSVDLVANDLATVALDAVRTYDIDGKLVKIDAEDNISDTLNKVNSYRIDDKTAKLTPMDMVTDMINDINNKQLDGKLTEIQARDLASIVMDQLNARSLDGKIADISANDMASIVLQSVAEYEIPGKDTVIRAVDNTAEGVASSTNNMFTVPSVFPLITATDGTAPGVGSATQTMASTPNVFRDIIANNGTGAGTNSSINTMASTPNVKRDISAVNTTAAGVSLAVQTMMGVKDRTVNIDAINRTGTPVDQAKAAIASVVGKTVDIVTRFFRQDDNANGGVYNSAGEAVFANGGILKSTAPVQAFADGGITKQAIKAFAGGGVENHTAQIARGAWPVRVWAEPETGGEAYIPLSKNKRKRSLDILKVVMREFGLDHLTHAFADGGVMKTNQSTTPQVVRARYSAPASAAPMNGVTATQTMAAPQIHVHPSQGLNEEQIGTIASDQLWFKIQNASY